MEWKYCIIRQSKREFEAEYNDVLKVETGDIITIEYLFQYSKEKRNFITGLQAQIATARDQKGISNYSKADIVRLKKVYIHVYRILYSGILFKIWTYILELFT